MSNYNCPCPVKEQFTVNIPTQVYNPGDIVPSPGGSFEYEIKSYAFSRVYYDVKGQFDKHSWKKLTEEELELFSYVRNGAFVLVPDAVRMEYTLLFYTLFSMSNSMAWMERAFGLTHILMPFKDNSPWIQTDSGKWEQGEYPCSYEVTLPGLSTKPFIRTIRWKYDRREIPARTIPES